MSEVTLVSPPIKLVLQLRPQICRLALIAMVCGLAGMILATGGRAQESPATPQSSPKASTAPPPQPVETPVLLPPSSLLPRDQVQPSKPQVSFDGKQLTIIANDSTLSEILTAVRAIMGAEIDLPTSGSGDRLPEVRLGPGPAREVLASLLSWTDFGYIIQASDKNPLGIQSVILVARNKTPVGGPTGSPSALASQLRPGANRRIAEPDPTPAVIPAPENSVAPQPGTSAETAASGPQQQPARQALASNPSQPQFRSTQEMIQELQGMFQQRRQMQINQNPPAASRPPTSN
jgi:hypothetical protein